MTVLSNRVPPVELPSCPVCGADLIYAGSQPSGQELPFSVEWRCGARQSLSTTCFDDTSAKFIETPEAHWYAVRGCLRAYVERVNQP